MNLFSSIQTKIAVGFRTKEYGEGVVCQNHSKVGIRLDTCLFNLLLLPRGHSAKSLKG